MAIYVYGIYGLGVPRVNDLQPTCLVLEAPSFAFKTFTIALMASMVAQTYLKGDLSKTVVH